MRTILSSFAIVLLALAIPSQAQPAGADSARLPPNLTVSGQGEAWAPPDEVIVRLGAVAQADQATAAQNQVNQVMHKALDAIKALGIAEDRISTVGLSLSPVYNSPRPGEGNFQPRIVAYRASNTIQVRLDDLKRIGDVIDAGVGAGANQLEGLSFQLKNDTEYRNRAMREAVQEAQAKAETLASAAGVRLAGILDIEEGGVSVVPRPAEMARAAFATGVPTPVQPGQIQVQANVTIRYRIARPGEPATR